jgi:hypothetical protein
MKTYNPDHNLWFNRSYYWTRFTVHYPDYTKGRIAKSLHTRDKAEARRRRDQLMKSTPGAVFPEVLPAPPCESSPMHYLEAEAA